MVTKNSDIMPTRAGDSQQTGADSKTKKTKGPEDDDTSCTHCKQKFCYASVVTGSGLNRREKKQKIKFEWISCDTCHRWFHGNCGGLQPDEVTTVVDRADSGVKWFCTDCAPGITSKTDQVSMNKLIVIEQMIASLDQKVETYQAQTTAETKKLERSWADIVSGDKLSDDIKKLQENVSNTQNMLTKDLDAKEAEKRKNNAILFGLMEENTAMEDIKKLMQHEIFKSFDAPEHAARLGTKGDTPRPIKLRFSDEKSKWEFLKRANSKLRENKIFCRLDVSAKVREQEYQLRQNIKQLKNQNNDQEYRIRNMTIEQKNKSSGEWEKVKPVGQEPHNSTA